MTTHQAPNIKYLKAIPKKSPPKKRFQTDYEQIQNQLFDEPDWAVDEDKELRDENELRNEDKAIDKRSEKDNH